MYIFSLLIAFESFSSSDSVLIFPNLQFLRMILQQMFPTIRSVSKRSRTKLTAVGSPERRKYIRIVPYGER